MLKKNKMMKTIRIFGFLILVVLFAAMKGDKPAYVIYKAEGKQVKYSDMAEDALKADIVFFGEQHNSPISHWMELELTKALFAEKRSSLIIGAEMFETDNQLLLDEYLLGNIAQKNFEKEAKLWDNYQTDYKPLVEFAKENKLPFVGTNIPRRYASLVNKKGFEGLDSLTVDAKALIAPLPVKYDPELKGYKAMLEMNEGMPAGSHSNENLPKAQAIKDATMAASILKFWKPGKTFLHYNGAYHSDNYEGIVWYLKQEKPELKIMTISTVEQDTISDLKKESINLADYIICVPTDMTKTY
jgi:uncharacterized iron-regulated protein